MTLVWLAVWFVASMIGGHEPLKLDPVNAWTATLIPGRRAGSGRVSRARRTDRLDGLPRGLRIVYGNTRAIAEAIRSRKPWGAMAQRDSAPARCGRPG